MKFNSTIISGILLSIGCAFTAFETYSSNAVIDVRATLTPHTEWQSLFASCNFSGTPVLFFPKENAIHTLDSTLLNAKYVVTSTFKIFNSLVSLETGALKDANEILQRNGFTRWVEKWNPAQNMKEAIANSTVWFFQECARRVGEEKMKLRLAKANYVASDISKGIDEFWLHPVFELSPHQQFDFLLRLQKKELPFSHRSMDIVKKKMIREEVGDVYSMHSKTSWFNAETSNIGWYFGWVDGKQGHKFFATCVCELEPSQDDFAKCRIEITQKVLQSMNVIPQHRR